MNSNHRIETTRGDYLLRIYNVERGLSEIDFELAVLGSLVARKFAEQRPMPRRDGTLISQVGAQHGALLSFLPGETLAAQALTPAIVQQVGAAVARMQNALDGQAFASSKPNADYNLIHRLAAAAIAQCRGCPQLADLVDILEAQVVAAEAIFGNNHVNLQTGLVHADISLENVLFDAGRLTGLIDFDDAYMGWLAGDVALTLMEFSSTESQVLSMELAEAILKGYAAVRALSVAEVVHLYPLMQLLCLKYFCYLLPLAQGIEKDILENAYFKRLVQLRDAGVQHAFTKVIYNVFFNVA